MLMSISEIERFAKDVADNDELQARVAGIISNPSAVMDLASASGYDFTLAELEHHRSQKSDELTAEDLENISAGNLGDVIPDHRL